jgi:predicted acetyltransferase
VRVLLEFDGEARAYAIYRLKAEWSGTGPKHVITVLEVIGVDAASEQALWQWLLGIDLVDVVKGWRMPLPVPLQLMVTEPRRLNVTASDGTWLRILDIAAALAGRTFRGPGSLVLDVTDTFRPANAGRWKLTTPEPGDGGARPTVVPTTAEPDLALDISALAAAYLGAWRFSDLLRAGRVRECREGAVAAADELFGTASSPSNSTMF